VIGLRKGSGIEKSVMDKRNLKKHQGTDICSNRRAMNEMAVRNDVLAQQMAARVDQLEEKIVSSVNILEKKMVNSVSTLAENVQKISSRPQTIINKTTINHYILTTKEPLSYAAIEASVAMGMQPAMLRDGASGIAMYVARENNLEKQSVYL